MLALGSYNHNDTHFNLPKNQKQLFFLTSDCMFGNSNINCSQLRYPGNFLKARESLLLEAPDKDWLG
jgi:hypothetical protein